MRGRKGLLGGRKDAGDFAQPPLLSKLLILFLGLFCLCACIFEKKAAGLLGLPARSGVALKEGAAAGAQTMRANGCPSQERKGPCVFRRGIR